MRHRLPSRAHVTGTASRTAIGRSDASHASAGVHPETTGLCDGSTHRHDRTLELARCAPTQQRAREQRTTHRVCGLVPDPEVGDHRGLEVTNGEVEIAERIGREAENTVRRPEAGHREAGHHRSITEGLEELVSLAGSVCVVQHRRGLDRSGDRSHPGARLPDRGEAVRPQLRQRGACFVRLSGAGGDDRERGEEAVVRFGEGRRVGEVGDEGKDLSGPALVPADRDELRAEPSRCVGVTNCDPELVALLGAAFRLGQAAAPDGDHHIECGDEVFDAGERCQLEPGLQFAKRSIDASVALEEQIDRSPRQAHQGIGLGA